MLESRQWRAEVAIEGYGDREKSRRSSTAKEPSIKDVCARGG